jgi:hypothetical protein
MLLIIRQGPTEARYTNALDHPGKLRIQVCQRALQDFAMARIRGSFELLEHMLAVQQQALPLALAGDLGGSQGRIRWTRRRHSFCLLFLDRLALPSSRHSGIIPARTMRKACFGKSVGQLVGEHKAKPRGADFQKIGPDDRKAPSWHQTCHPRKIKSLLVRKLGL